MEVARFELAVSDLFCRAEWEEVIDQYQGASEIVQDYPPLLSRLLYAYGNLGREREWDSVYALLEPRMNQLTTTERLWVEWAHGIYRGNHVEAMRAVEQLYRIQPGMAGFHAGYTALRTNRFEEAIERLQHHDLEAPCFRRWYPWWAAMTEAYHMVGRDEDALAVAQEGRERFPHAWMLLYWEAISHAGLGNLAAVDSLLDVIEGLPVQTGYSPGQQITRLALELRTLGYREAYAGAIERAQAWFATRPSTELRLPRGWAFYYGERWSDADTLFAALSALDPDNVDYRGFRAVALVHLGRNDEVLEIAAWLEQQQSPFGSPGGHTRWRAAIAAALGHRAEAVQLLQQAYDEGMDLGHNHRRDPEWESLRDYGPYREFVGPRG